MFKDIIEISQTNLNMKNDSLDDLDAQLAEANEKHRYAVEQIANWTVEKRKWELERKYLIQRRRLAGGAPLVKEEAPAKTIAQMVEEILKLHGPLYIDKVLFFLAQPPYDRPGIEKQTVVGTLGRYIRRGEVFARVGKNTFALLNDSEVGGDK